MSIMKVNHFIPSFLFDDYNTREQFHNDDKHAPNYIPGANIIETIILPIHRTTTLHF
ncbi:hypothetical protein RCC89_02370 [Cytophagaceae bacterium ABcell3]|nr:hypothetical protein RCC89_02370 [Cytophagaceae bacterium ABcell3]